MHVPSWLRPLTTRLNLTRVQRVPQRPAFRPRVERLEDRTLPSTFWVTNTLDDGSANSLRWAINQANADTDPLSNINFNILGTGMQTITLTAALPAITHPVVLNGYTQPGSRSNTHAMTDPDPSDNAVRLITLSRGPGDPTTEGLVISGGGSTVEGLVSQNFPIDLHITGNGANLIAGNAMSLILVDNSPNNTIGGLFPAARNVILEGPLISGGGPLAHPDSHLFFGNGVIFSGINVVGSGATGNLVEGNFIGTDGSNEFNGGVLIDGASNTTIGGSDPRARNIIGGVPYLGSVGVLLADLTGTKTTDNNDVEGNYIGLNATGTATLNPSQNGSGGVLLSATACRHNRIQGNAIAGYGENVSLGDTGGYSSLPTTGNVIDGNFLGTNASGTAAMPGNGDGLKDVSGGGNTISNNLISGNGNGVLIGANGDLVEGNLIGTDFSGAHPIPNGWGIAADFASNGVITGNTIKFNNTGIDVGGSNNVITGNTIAYSNGVAADSGSGVRVGYNGEAIGNRIEGNAIYGNQGPGVWIPAGPLVSNGGFYGAYATGNSILGNSIHDNGGLGIDLGDIPYDSAGNVTSDFSQWDYSKPDGVTLNDSHTLTDSQGLVVGPNHFQNYPVITAATFGPATTTVSGTLNSASNATFTLDFYASPASDPSGYGQGKYYLGSTTVTTGGNGNATFTNVAFATPAIQGDAISVITATATDSQGDTSEFSQAFALNDVTVFGTSGNDTITVTPGATPGSAGITMNGNPLGTFTPAGHVRVYGEGGTDTYSITFGSNLTTPVDVTGGGADTLNAYGSTDPNTSNYIVKTSGSPSNITWGASSSPPAETLTYSGIQPVNIYGGAGNNYITDPGSQTTIYGGPKQNTVTITATSGSGVVINGGPSTSINTYIIDMGNLLGPVSINSTAGTSTVTVNAPPGSNVLTLSATQLTGAGQTINFNLGTTAASLTVAGGAGNNNQLVVQGTPPGPLTAQYLAPTVGAISAPLAPTAVNTAIAASAGFSNQDGNNQTAVWNWGDGTKSPGAVSQTGKTGTVTGSHSYATDGVFTIILTVTDSKGGGATTSAFQYEVVYNPSAGFATGGGWITSPAGAYAANPPLTGKATFGLNAKYKSGATVPTGNTEFQFPAANLDFHATSYDWLVITTNQAQYQGSGTINGAGNYGFLVTAQDNGGTKPDLFRMKIWDKNNNNAVVYDTQPGAASTAAPTTALGGGRIQVHTNAQLVAGGANPNGGNVAVLTPKELQPVVQEAIAAWASAGIDSAQFSALSHVAVSIADFPGPWLGMAFPGAVWIDEDAAGYGWYIDATPAAGGSAFPAAPGSPAYGKVDLLTVVEHELGHELGFADTTGDGLMGVFLGTGTRRVPTLNQQEQAVVSHLPAPTTDPTTGSSSLGPLMGVSSQDTDLPFALLAVTLQGSPLSPLGGEPVVSSNASLPPSNKPMDFAVAKERGGSLPLPLGAQGKTFPTSALDGLFAEFAGSRFDWVLVDSLGGPTLR